MISVGSDFVGKAYDNDTALPSETCDVAANTSMNLRKANRQ